MRRKVGVHRAAVDKSIAALATGPEHAALVESARSMADSMDLSPVFDDRLWREYRMTLRALMDRATGGANDGFDAEFDALRTEVGDTAKP